MICAPSWHGSLAAKRGRACRSWCSRFPTSAACRGGKRGLPRGADMVLDTRFLRNPHWEASLRSQNGTSLAVQDYVAADARFDSFFARVSGLVEELLPAYKEEGKTHFAIAFGCTGGRHRSVTLTERLAKALAETGWQVSIRHRELERGEMLSGAPLKDQKT